MMEGLPVFNRQAFCMGFWEMNHTEKGTRMLRVAITDFYGGGPLWEATF